MIRLWAPAALVARHRREASCVRSARSILKRSLSARRCPVRLRGTKKKKAALASRPFSRLLPKRLGPPSIGPASIDLILTDYGL
jgi:hypothetical protein